jgi:flagellar secretion chaperone FliS
MSPALAYASYRNSEISTLNQRDLIVKLYRGAENFLLQSAASLAANDGPQAILAGQKARAIFSELMATLDFERGGDIAKQLSALYTFFINDITDALASNDAVEMRKMVPIVANLREAWEGIPSEIAAGGGASAGKHCVDLRR